ncbi:putative Josephin-2 [Hypsibius exemplaris]|uniref:ubiquitinyl hydrolase 1 n=1 Tax=Hypsibius exemplaris TaxID=2072580 RepID=A0A1W0WGU2_HYPEX|nr:putative Josephin-2 [Hypsibius exemplaris]
MDSRSMPIYHEHQVKQFCALHALNNLFGESCFTKKSLDDICERLAPTKGWGNPHRSFFGFGNWDVNVVMVAVQSKNCEAVWWDKRNDLSNLDLKPIVGFILNIPNDYAIGSFKLPLGRRHWISIRPIVTSGSPVQHQSSRSSSTSKAGSSETVNAVAGQRESRRLFYNLDSKFKVPLLIGNDAAVLAFLQEALGIKGGEMLVVVTKDSTN